MAASSYSFRSTVVCSINLQHLQQEMARSSLSRHDHLPALQSGSFSQVPVAGCFLVTQLYGRCSGGQGVDSPRSGVTLVPTWRGRLHSRFLGKVERPC